MANGDKRDLLKGLAIGVLYGGPSSEREVSLESGENVSKALSAAGHQVQRVILDGSFTVRDAQSLGIDVAFLALHGEFGEDGRIQSILEEADIPYTGSGIDASATAFDKVLAKRAFERAGVCTPAWMSLEVGEIEKMGGTTGLYLVPPLVIKPATGGSSLGVTIAKNENQVGPGINKAFEYGDTILLERYIQGREVTVGVLGDDALPVAELCLQSDFYDYNAKYNDDRTKIVCPADMSDELSDRVRKTGLAAHRALGCRDYSRTDIIIDKDGIPWVLEVNTLPGMTSHSLLPRAAQAADRNFTQLCEELLRRSLDRTMKAHTRL
jgi:D-alanine-D-alanine ligase